MHDFYFCLLFEGQSGVNVSQGCCSAAVLTREREIPPVGHAHANDFWNSSHTVNIVSLRII